MIRVDPDLFYSTSQALYNAANTLDDFAQTHQGHAIGGTQAMQDIRAAIASHPLAYTVNIDPWYFESSMAQTTSQIHTLAETLRSGARQLHQLGVYQDRIVQTIQNRIFGATPTILSGANRGVEFASPYVGLADTVGKHYTTRLQKTLRVAAIRLENENLRYLAKDMSWMARNTEGFMSNVGKLDKGLGVAGAFLPTLADLAERQDMNTIGADVVAGVITGGIFVGGTTGIAAIGLKAVPVVGEVSLALAVGSVADGLAGNLDQEAGAEIGKSDRALGASFTQTGALFNAASKNMDQTHSINDVGKIIWDSGANIFGGQHNDIGKDAQSFGMDSLRLGASIDQTGIALAMTGADTVLADISFGTNALPLPSAFKSSVTHLTDGAANMLTNFAAMITL